MFWPRSKTCTPGARSVIATGRRSSVTRIGCERSGTSSAASRGCAVTGRPAVVAEARLGPRAELPARVVALAHQQVRVLERAGGGSPARVAGDHLDAAVLVLDVQLAQQRRVLAVVVAPPQRVHADEAGVPAGAEDRAEHVLAVAQERADVVRRVLDPRAVVGPSGREDGVADARAVELHLQHAAGGRVERRAAHRARHRERPPQVRAAQQPAQQLVRGVVARGGGHRRVVNAIAADPLRAPRARARCGTARARWVRTGAPASSQTSTVQANSPAGGSSRPA